MLISTLVCCLLVYSDTPTFLFGFALLAHVAEPALRTLEHAVSIATLAEEKANKSGTSGLVQLVQILMVQPRLRHNLVQNPRYDVG